MRREARAVARALLTVLGTVARHPVQSLLRHWNYKSALTSAATRGALFFAANVSAGWDAATAALVTECAFRACTAGFYGAFTQAFRHVEPARAAIIAASIALPLVAHSLELLVHWLRGTPNLGLSIAVSVAFTVVSTSFNVFAMRRGVFVVGAGARSLVDDFKRLPGLLRDFTGLRQVV